VELKKLWKNKRTLAFQALNLGSVLLSSSSHLLSNDRLLCTDDLEGFNVPHAIRVSCCGGFEVSCPPCLLLTLPSLSGSMMPAFQRGDILFLTNYNDPIRVGEIVVFKIKDRDIPIVHRVLRVHEKEDGEVEVLTKGDANRVDDIGLYAPGQRWLKRSDILGERSTYPIVSSRLSVSQVEPQGC
jgi:signal peptidase I